MKPKKWIYKKGTTIQEKLQKMMKCILSGERLRADETISSSESLATRDYSAGGYSSRAGEAETRADANNIEQAESSLRESGFLNYEEARALLGRLEFQKGNIEAALHVFEGIDITAVVPKMKVSISRRCDPDRRRSQSDAAPLMSVHAVSLLCEAIFLKSKSLQCLGKLREAAQSCRVILDTVESASPEGLTEEFCADCKLHETLSKAVELLPELWKLSGAFQETILSYRRALLHRWNLDIETMSRIQKEFAIFLLYNGCEAIAPDLRSQMDGSFIPRTNTEEAILLLLILLKNTTLGRIRWDPTVMDHLTFASSVSGELRTLAHQIEDVLPGAIERKEMYRTLAFCYYGEGENTTALNLLRNMLRIRDDQNRNSILCLLLASKICEGCFDCAEEGMNYSRQVLAVINHGCAQLVSVANCILGVLLSARSRLATSDSDRILRQGDALEALRVAEKTMIERDPSIIYIICVENAEQGKLDVALRYAKQLLEIEAGGCIKSYMLLARVLSAQKRFIEAETIMNAALDETGKWDQGELLRTKARLQIAQGQYKNAIETYTHLLAVLQLQAKSFKTDKVLQKNAGVHDRSLEMDTWHDLANMYTNLCQWQDAEACLLKSEAISPHSASRWHSIGLLYQAKHLHVEALRSYEQALSLEPNHGPSLVSISVLLSGVSQQPSPIVRSFLSEALKLSRTNASAWYNLGLLCKLDGGAAAALEAADCFEAAAALEDSAPIEPFR